MEVDEYNDDVKKITSSNARPRTKKKSTLTRLKERQQKELGSQSSLKEENVSSFDSSSKNENNIKVKRDAYFEPKLTDKLNSVDNTQFSAAESTKISTKDSPPQQKRKPRPLPRVNRRSSEASAENVDPKYQSIANNVDASNMKHYNSERVPDKLSRNLKMDSDQNDSVESAISQSSFVPKPPSTPRKPRSNPRTPRGFILAAKGEKLIKDPFSSGGEELDADSIKNNSNTINGQLGGFKETTESVVISQVNNEAHQLSTTDTLNTNGDSASVSHKPPVKQFFKKRLKQMSQSIKNESDSLEGFSKISYPILSNPPSSDSFFHKQEFQTSPTSESTSLLKSNRFDEQPNQNSISSISEFGINLDKNSTVLTNTNENNNDSFNDNVPGNITQDNVGFHQTGGSSDNQPGNDLNTAESPHKFNLVSTSPRISRLDPISPMSHPPPLPEELSSLSLRTIYKIDPDVYHRKDTSQLATVTTKTDSRANSNADHLSQRSMTSVSVLPVITTKEARSRHGFDGSIVDESPSSLGFDELERYFPDRKVNVFVGTWNMNELKDLTLSLDDFILPEKCDYVHDIYAIGTQENNANKKEWEVKIQETLGPSHVLLHSISLGSLHLAVFIRRDLIWFCSVPEDDIISFRTVTIVKTKGAIAICFNLFGTSYLFINSHLTSDRNNEVTRKKSRLEDYCKVISEMKLPKSTEKSSPIHKPTDVTAVFDCIFWFGDLNFRIEHKRHIVQMKVDQMATEEFPHFESLLASDQLLNYMTEGKIFGGFQEGRIIFNPTYKFDLDKDTYDSSTKNRTPSYTDRIMFRSKKKHGISCMQYDGVFNIKLSDHRPVYGLYETAIKPSVANTIYSVGHFDKFVYMEAIQRRKIIPTMRKKQSAICSIQ